jgi:hypothetical protein
VLAKLAGKARYTEVELVGVSKRVTLNQELLKSTKETLRLKLNRSKNLRCRHYRIADGEAVKVNEFDTEGVATIQCRLRCELGS